MKMTKWVSVFGVFLLAMGFTSCPIELDATGVTPRTQPWGSATFSQTLTAYETGWLDAPMTVSVTFRNGRIDRVEIDHNETPSHGGVLIDRVILLAEIANTFDLDIIASSSHIVTRNALMRAFNQIRSQVPGEGGGSGSTTPPFQPPEGVEAWNPPASGMGIGFGEGWTFAPQFIQEGYGDPALIRALVTMQDGFITEVNLYGPGESGGWGRELMQYAEEFIPAHNTYDIAPLHTTLVPNVIASSTYTMDGIMDAVYAAIQFIIDNDITLP